MYLFTSVCGLLRVPSAKLLCLSAGFQGSNWLYSCTPGYRVLKMDMHEMDGTYM